MDMEKRVATKIALTALAKAQTSDHFDKIQAEVDWKKLERLVPEDNLDELFEKHLKDSESFIQALDKLNKEVDAEIKRLESSLMI